ncbi:MAG: PAS domain S-box protein [Candidatus Natronoplasma sp.]
MRVLLVDDDTSLLDQAKEFLEEEKEELKVFTVESAKKALELLEADHYDAIVSDYMMPEMDGIEFLRELREERENSIPFLIFTGRGREDVAMDALNLGADRYVMKEGNLESRYGILADAIAQEVRHKETAEELVEINSLLMSIRNIGRLIFEEDKFSTLIEKSCDVLLETGGYLNVEIALFDDDSGKIKPFASSGEHEHWAWELTKEGEGDAPECVKEAMRTRSSVMIEGMKDYCSLCDYPEEDIDHHTVLVPMTSDEELFGFLIVCHRPDRFLSRKEIELLEEVVDDLSLARRRMIAEKTLEEERDLFVEGSTTLFKWRAKENYPIVYVTPNVEYLLGYTQEEMISGDISYADILPKNDFVQLKREVERHLNIGADRIDHRPYRLIKKNGETIWVKDYTKIIREDGEVKYYLGYLVDITAQKQTEEALQMSEERYRRLFESAKDGILILNSETGEIKDANPYIRDILSYSLDELQEGKLWEIGSFEQICENKERFDELREEGYVRYEDLPLESRNGEKVPVEFVSNVYRAGGEEVIQCNIREISERKKAEEELEEQYRLLQNLLGNAPGVAFRCLNDEYYTMKFMSEGCKEVTGYYPEDLIDNKETTYIDLILPEDRKKVRSTIDEAVEKKERYKIIYRIKTAEGEIRWVWERGKGAKNDEDEVYLEGIIMDITEMKEMERQLLKSEERYRTIFQSANDAIIIMDREQFIDCNEKAEEMFGCDRGEIIGKKPWHFSPEEQPDGRRSKEKALEKIKQVFEGEDPFFEWVHKKNNGDEFYAEVSLNRYDIGDEPRIIAVIRDITDRKEVEERKEFLHSMICHDVGNKTQIAKAYLKLLKETYEDEELVDKTVKVINQTQEIIEKVDKLRRVEEQENIREVPIEPLREEVLSKYETHLEDMDIDLEVEREEIQVKAGPLLETLFFNLIENSIRHSGCEKIRIRVLSEDDKGLIIFEDDGVGIPDEKKEKILEKGFKQGKSGGSGLGLYLVKKVIDSYDGRLEVKDSELGGVRFDIYLERA